jgi:hypothetical protein
MSYKGLRPSAKYWSPFRGYGSNEWRLHTKEGNRPLTEFIAIDFNDEKGTWEVWSGDNWSGDSETVGYYRTKEKAEEAVKKFLKKNPEGVYRNPELLSKYLHR